MNLFFSYLSLRNPPSDLYGDVESFLFPQILKVIIAANGTRHLVLHCSLSKYYGFDQH